MANAAGNGGCCFDLFMWNGGFLWQLATFLATRARKGYFFAVSGLMAEPSAANV